LKLSGRNFSASQNASRPALPRQFCHEQREGRADDHHGDERPREEPRVFIGAAIQTHRVAQGSQHERAREQAEEIEPRPRDRTQLVRFDGHDALQCAHKRTGLRFVRVVVRAHLKSRTS